MPEGDSVHKLAAYLDTVLTGRTLVKARIRALPDVELSGCRVTTVRAHGKHLFIHLDDGRVLHSHLGMYGSWHHYRCGTSWRKPAHQAAIELYTGDQVLVCFNPLMVDLALDRGPAQRDLEAHLGPDLLSPDLDPGSIPARAHALLPGEAPLVDVLLDQRVAAGIGNVYKSEILYLMGLQPLQALARTPDATLEAAYALAARLLRANLGLGRRVTRARAAGTGDLWVYGRRGQPCHRCGAIIHDARLARGQRPTYWYPVCQADAGPGSGHACV